MGITPVAATGPTPQGFEDGHYIIELSQPPVAGELVAAQDIDAVESQEDVLESIQGAVAQSVGADVEQNYTVAINGFSATLTAEQAEALSEHRQVRSVSVERIYEVQAQSTTEYLGLGEPTGLWSQVGGVDAAGEGVVVGVLDSGISPDNPTMAGSPLTANATDPATPHLADGGIAMVKADGQTFTGVCQTGPGFDASDCSTKIVGARYFDNAVNSGSIWVVGDEYRSPRDYNGHGSHTASIAAGNAGVDASYADLDSVTISGVAPAAKVAVYKVCWQSILGPTQCGESDLIAGIEAAIRDGVDVINYSIGSSNGDDTVSGPVDLALLRASSAGIFVSASAGNSGSGASTIDHTEPWLTTVAATTSAQEATVIAGEFSEVGASVTVFGTGVTDLPLVLDTSRSGARFCREGSLSDDVQGAVVLCARMTNDSATLRREQTAEVRRAGGVAAIIANTASSPQDVLAETHLIPTVHVTRTVGEALTAYVPTSGSATVSFLPFNTTGESLLQSPQVATFSSRGPARTSSGNILKPDVAAPGVAVLAAVSNASGKDPQYRLMSGTSMAAPHVAGLAAVYLSTSPHAGPAEIKSALMTTAGDTHTSEGEVNTDHFADGAGQIAPQDFLNPGFVYKSGQEEWNGYLNGLGVDTGSRDTPIHGSEVNQASLAIGQLVTSREVTRTVTATAPGRYTAHAALPGYDVSVQPSVLEFTKAGQEISYRITVTRVDAPLGEYAQGNITWVGEDMSSRFPIAVKAVSTSTEPPLAELPAQPEDPTDDEVEPKVLTGSVPTVSGSPQVGKRLAAQSGTWTAGAQLTYQWFVGGQRVDGATGSTFTARASDVGKSVTVQ
ncbi:S8 family serine peptidase, partial [Populibacterium corticicola]